MRCQARPTVFLQFEKVEHGSPDHGTRDLAQSGLDVGVIGERLDHRGEHGVGDGVPAATRVRN